MLLTAILCHTLRFIQEVFFFYSLNVKQYEKVQK